jgi:2-octaprenyl-6-methoxyphenol hydroxylase
MGRTADVLVVGGGPAGTAAALALAGAGLKTTLVAGPPAKPDNRTTALLAGSVRALESLDVWPRCADKAAPLRVMRIADDTGRLLRAPEVAFDSGEIGLEAFGWNIANTDLMAALRARAAELPDLTIIPAPADRVDLSDDCASVDAAGDTLTAPVIVAADGRKSLVRDAAGIATRTSVYPQTAITLNLTHTRPHHDASTEFHTPSGPFTLVPLPGLRCSLVCVVAPADADALLALDPVSLARNLERRAHSILGKFTVEAGRGVWPLSSVTAERFGAHRALLVGEAGHVFPPIGAQGLNLGLRDAALAAEVIAEAATRGEDTGGTAVTDRYHRLRAVDVTMRTTAVDLLNRSLLSSFLPVAGIRGAGLHALKSVGPLRRLFMREGVAPRIAEPKLMRGEVLAARP